MKTNNETWATVCKRIFAILFSALCLSIAASAAPLDFRYLPDNTLQNIYIDRAGAVWIGTYKNGIAYYSPSLSHFPTVTLGDICTIATDD